MANNQNQDNFEIKELREEESRKLGVGKSASKFVFNKKYLKIGLIAVVFIILVVVGTLVVRMWFSFSENKVELDITAPTEISSGEEIEFTINCKNNNRISLKDVELAVNYPQGTYSLEGEELTREFVELGDIPAQKGYTKDFKVRLSGEKGNIKPFVARLSYRTENTSSYFEKSDSFQINIDSVLIGLYLTVPQKAVSGEEVSYILDYINTSAEDFSDLQIKLNYSSDFSFNNAEPEPSTDNNIWQLNQLKSGERGTLKIYGSLLGAEGENKALTALIEKIENNKFLKYTQTTAITQISSAPLQLSLFLNEEDKDISVSCDQELSYRISFRNNSDIALSQLVLKLYFQGDMFDFKTLKLREQGFFDSLNNVISWSAGNVSSLALLPPGETGKVEFSLSVKDNFSINSWSDNNFQILARAELETLNVPPQFNLKRLKIEKTLISKVNSKVILQTKGYYNETAVNISNFGPIPPRVNQTTAYTIHWQVTNTSNDLGDVRITTVLPQGVNWRDVYVASNQDTDIEYNERTKQIVWKIAKMPAATGFLLPVSELVFQVSIQPSVTQIGTTPILIDESRLEAKDIFTEESLESFDSAIATNLPDDLSVGFNEGKVVE